jgi:hypothetical protein
VLPVTKPRIPETTKNIRCEMRSTSLKAIRFAQHNTRLQKNREMVIQKYMLITNYIDF